MSMLVSGITHIDPNNVPLASLVAQEEHVDVNFIRNNNFNNNAYRNNFGSNNYRPYPSTNGNGYGNSYKNNRNMPSDLEVMLIVNKLLLINLLRKSLVKLMFLLLKLLALLLMLNF
jgi:hypothetical protein